MKQSTFVILLLLSPSQVRVSLLRSPSACHLHLNDRSFSEYAPILWNSFRKGFRQPSGLSTATTFNTVSFAAKQIMRLGKIAPVGHGWIVCTLSRGGNHPKIAAEDSQAFWIVLARSHNGLTTNNACRNSGCRNSACRNNACRNNAGIPFGLGSINSTCEQKSSVNRTYAEAAAVGSYTSLTACVGSNCVPTDSRSTIVASFRALGDNAV
jgi:hypothetical protein